MVPTGGKRMVAGVEGHPRSRFLLVHLGVAIPYSSCDEQEHPGIAADLCLGIPTMVALEGVEPSLLIKELAPHASVSAFPPQGH